MKTYVVGPNRRPKAAQLPYAILETDNWDDYGYKTLFHLLIVLSPAKTVAVGRVKIAQMGMSSDPGGNASPVLEPQFEGLGDDYVSLGQDFAYYEVVATLPEKLRQELLDGLQDAVWLPRKRDQFVSQEVWETSILRQGAAENALADAGALLGVAPEGVPSLPDRVLFETTVGGTDFTLELNYKHPSLWTSRINAIIGYNGSGKTRLLVNLSEAAFADRKRRSSPDFQSEFGRFVGPAPTYAATIMVSYSAFDTFTWPVPPRGSEGGQESFGYSYCGLRVATDRATDNKDRRRLKSSDELQDEFIGALARVRVLERLPELEQALQPLVLEPSFARGRPPEGLRWRSESELRTYYDSSSTGHKIALSIVVHLVLRLQPRSLVIIDEPEAHLHPSLLAALLQSLTWLLDNYDSQAVVATHSPVVLQEIPSLCVAVLRRRELRTRVRRPSMEIFGENVGLITAHVFHLDSTSTDFHGMLDRWAEDMTVEQADELFLEGLSGEARSYFLSQQYEADDYGTTESAD